MMDKFEEVKERFLDFITTNPKWVYRAYWLVILACLATMFFNR